MFDNATPGSHAVSHDEEAIDVRAVGREAAAPGKEERRPEPPASSRRPSHADLGTQPYFVTSRFRTGAPRLVGMTARIAMDELLAQRERHHFLLLAFVLMPDHAHFVVVPLNQYSIAQTMRVIKGGIARRVNAATGTSGSLWQSGFFDKNPKDARALNDFIAYTESNPIRARLCASASQYEFSSAGGRCTKDYESFFALVQGDR